MYLMMQIGLMAGDAQVASFFDGITESPCKRCHKKGVDKNECLGSEPFCPGGHARPKLFSMNRGSGRPKKSILPCDFPGCKSNSASKTKFGFALCKKHKNTVKHRHNRGQPLLVKNIPKRKCAFPGCEKNSINKYCTKCNAVVKYRINKGWADEEILTPRKHKKNQQRTNLDLSEIAEIKKSDIPYRSLASKYKISHTTVCSIKKGRGIYAEL